MALRAPSTSRCDFCQVSFCGIGIPERCYASSLRSQHLNGFSDLGDLIQAADIYECFEGNAVEVEILFDYLTEHRMPPKQIYQEVRVSRVDRPKPPNHLSRSSNTFRTPLSSSHRSSTRSSSLRSTAWPEVSIPTRPRLDRRFAGGVPPRFSCGVSVIGGSRRGGRVAFQLQSSINRTVVMGSLVEIRRIQVRRLLSLCDLMLTQTRRRSRARVYAPRLSPLDDVMLKNRILFLVNHMIDAVTDKTAEPIAGPSHTSAGTSGAALNHHEPQGIAAN